MADSQGVQQWVELADFTAGISNRYHSAVIGDAPDGVAQVADTFGCYGAPEGGLVPLPDTGDTQTQDFFDAEGYPEGFERVDVTAATIETPVMRGSTDAEAVYLNDPDNPDQLFVAFNWYAHHPDDDPDTFRDKHLIKTYRPYVVGWTDPMDGSPAPDSALLEKESVGMELAPSHLEYGVASFAHTRDSQTAVPTDPGDMCVAMAVGKKWHVGGAGGDDHDNFGCWAYPDITNPDFGLTVDTPAYIDQPPTPVTLIGHQGRLVALQQWGYGYAGQFKGQSFGWFGALPGAEAIGFWDPNVLGYTPVDIEDPRPAVDSFHSIQGIVGEEQHHGYGAWLSVNASELFLVKHNGGAVVIRGDVARPLQVVKYPSIPSTDGVTARGCMTPGGFVYGNKTGVWMWNGADNAQNISPKLDGFFWDPGLDRRAFGAQIGSFACQYPFLYAPNNWVCDLRTGGWFRSDNPNNGVYAFHEASASGAVYAIVGSITDPTGGVLWQKFQPTDTFRNQYSWRSQPLAKSRGRMLRFRQAVMLVQGKGTVYVQLTGIGGDTEQVSVTVDSESRPVAFVKTLKLDGSDVDVRIVSVGGFNEIQTLTVTGAPTGGTFTPTINSVALSALAYDASVAAFQAAVDATALAGDLTISGTPGAYTLTFGNGLAATSIPTSTATNTFTGGTSPSVSVATTTQGASSASGAPRLWRLNLGYQETTTINRQSD